MSLKAVLKQPHLSRRLETLVGFYREELMVMLLSPPRSFLNYVITSVAWLDVPDPTWPPVRVIPFTRTSAAA